MAASCRRFRILQDLSDLQAPASPLEDAPVKSTPSSAAVVNFELQMSTLARPAALVCARGDRPPARSPALRPIPGRPGSRPSLEQPPRSASLMLGIYSRVLAAMRVSRGFGCWSPASTPPPGACGCMRVRHDARLLPCAYGPSGALGVPRVHFHPCDAWLVLHVALAEHSGDTNYRVSLRSRKSFDFLSETKFLSPK